MTSVAGVPDEVLQAVIAEERHREKARRRISHWARQGPGTEVAPVCELEKWQQDAARKLEKLYRWAAQRGGGARTVFILLMAAPPQSGKSLVVSRRGPAWGAAQLGLSFAVCSYAASLAQKHVMGCRALLKHDSALAIWPHLRTRGDEHFDRQTEFSVPRRDGQAAVVMARGRRGALTGEMTDVITLDDMYSSGADYGSLASRREVDDFLRTQVVARLMERGGGLVDMGTRWGTGDTRAWWEKRIKEMEDAGLTVHVEEAIYPLRGDEPWRHGERGYLTARWDEKKEAAARILYGSMAPAILDCAPVDDVGGIFDRDKHLCHHYDGSPAMAAMSCTATYLSVDPAETAGGGDWSVIQRWGVRGADSLLLNQWRGQWDPGTLTLQIQNAIAETRPNGVLVENTSGGKVALAALKQSVRGLVDVPTAGQGSKRDKIAGTLLLWQQGNVLLPRRGVVGADWCYRPDDDGLCFVDRLARLRGERPDMRGEVDDEADAAQIFLRWVMSPESCYPAAEVRSRIFKLVTGRG